VADALANAGVQEGDLSAVAVTIGPGLSMCLRGCLHILVLLKFSRILAFCLNCNTFSVTDISETLNSC
jgi:tRNA A37 threonylcarbamoyltransferase TsaD